MNTSDLWIWPGVGKHKGKDFAVTGTWGANGEAYFWDVTDPSKMAIIDTITVDARTVNDVKVSEDGRVGVITREGASNRKNGFVVLDITDPYNVKITAEFNDDMTGGVHNVFIYDNHVYAVNNGRKYDVINIEDPYNPFRVSRYELDTPGHGVHDVWVEDGIAYSSNWADGVFNLTGTWMTADFDSGMGDNVGAFAMPTWNGGVAGGGSFALPWHISSKASNPDLAAKFLAHLMSNDFVDDLMEVGRVPAQAPTIAPTSNLQAEVIASSNALVGANAKTFYTDWATPGMYDVVTQELQKLIGGAASAEDFISAMAAESLN